MTTTTEPRRYPVSHAQTGRPLGTLARIPRKGRYVWAVLVGTHEVGAHRYTVGKVSVWAWAYTQAAAREEIEAGGYIVED